MIETVDQVKQIISQPGFDPYSEAGSAALSQVKRPSPAFEYIMQLQSLQAQQTPGNAAGWQTQVNNPMNAAALQTAAQNYGQLNAQSDQFEAGEKNSELGMQLAFLAAVAGGAAGGYFGGGEAAAGMGADPWGAGAPGWWEGASPLNGASGNVIDSVAPAVGGWGDGASLGLPNGWQYTAQGVGDGTSSFNVTDVPDFGVGSSDPWGAGAPNQSLSVGNLNVPNYGGSIMDQFPAAAPTGNAGWDSLLSSGASSASSGASSLGNLLSGLNSNKLLGTAIGALAGSANGQKQAGTTTTTQDVPEYLKPYYLDLISKGQAQTNQAPADYSQSDALLKSIMAGTANPYVNQNNPYFENTLNLALNDTQGRVNNQFRNNAFGGSANQEMLTRNLGDQSNSMRFGQYKNAQDLYGTELNRATSVATGMPQYNAQKTTANFQPLLNQKSLLSKGGSQSTSPYYTNPSGGALYGGLLGSQLFGGK